MACRLACAGAVVVLVDDGRTPWSPVGQQLASSAFPLLQALGVAEEFSAGAVQVQESRSAWVGDEMDRRHGLANPYGPAWAVDRARLDPLLRAAAIRAGARLVLGRARTERTADGSWTVIVDGVALCRAPVIVDASGSARRFSRELLTWNRLDRMRCSVWHTRPGLAGQQSWSLVEASPDGWWYSAPTPQPGQLTVLRVENPAGHDRPVPPPYTAHRLGGAHLPRPTALRTALVGCAHRPWSPGVVAAGDAAMSVDPLSSSGLRHALELAEPAAAAARALVDGDVGAAEGYATLLRTAFTRHLTERRQVLSAASRFRDLPFWASRIGR